MASEEKDYLWDHFKFNADQRLKAFNFFVVFSVFANGGVFAAVEKEMPALAFVLIGGFVVVLAVVFWMIDVRSKWLLDISVPGLKEFEAKFPPHSQLFSRDATEGPRKARYTNAFRILFIAQIVFGGSTVAYGLRLLLL